MVKICKKLIPRYPCHWNIYDIRWLFGKNRIGSPKVTDNNL
jgi:hypothetical protein